MAIKKIKLPNNTTVDINDARDVVIGDGVENVVALTSAEYEALSTKDPNTAYIITDDTDAEILPEVINVSFASAHYSYASAGECYL